MTLTLDQIALNVERYKGVREELTWLHMRHLEALHIANRSRLEEMKAHLEGRTLEPIASRYYELAEAIEKRMADLAKDLPCHAFAERFGWELHELYKEKYPIGYETKLEEIGYLTAGIASFSYMLPMEPMLISDYAPDAMPISALRRQHNEARIEQWGWPQRNLKARLAWAPELNTVYVFPR